MSYKKRIALSKANLDIEMRNVVRKVSHRPRAEIIQIVRERTGAAIDEDYLTQLLAEKEA